MAPQGDTPSKTRKPGCIPCRERHLRCDRVVPTCSACRKSRQPRRCEYAGSVLRVKPSVYTERARGSRSTDKTTTDGRSTSIAVSSILITPADSEARSASPASSPLSRTQTQPQTAVVHAGSHSPERTRHRNSHSHSLSPRSSGGGAPRLARWSPVSLPRHVVANPEDAVLFEFYIRETGVWLDVVSPTAFFSETVPRLALHDPVLFSACLSYAARIRTLTGALDKERGELYGSRAIEALLSKLSSRNDAPGNAGADDVLSATVVILRMAEQFSEMQEDMRCHLMGASSLFARNPDHAFDGAVAFWVYKRQSIRMAVINEEPCDMEEVDMDIACGGLGIDDGDGDVDGDGRSLAPVSDEAWANRATYLFARACSICWDHTLADEARDVLLEDLHHLLTQWNERIPDTYQPWARYQAPDDPFPTLRYVSTWHVVGWQYYYGAKVLVGLYRRPAKDTQTNVLALSRYMEAEVLTPTRILCGITMASPAFGSTINGTALISWLGQVFSNKDDQNRLLNFLQDFMHETKWPNETCCQKLRRIWSGESRSWLD